MSNDESGRGETLLGLPQSKLRQEVIGRTIVDKDGTPYRYNDGTRLFGIQIYDLSNVDGAQRDCDSFNRVKDNGEFSARQPFHVVPIKITDFIYERTDTEEGKSR